MAHPRDALFKTIFTEPANIASELRAALPPEITAHLDLDRLKVEPGSFIEPDLRPRSTDILLSAPLNGRKALVYVLVEHQSQPDPLMPWRMLRYQVLIWESYLKEHPKARRFPVIIPVVVHAGKWTWTAPVDFTDLLDADPATLAAIGKHLVSFRLVLDDLGRIRPDQVQELLRARSLTQDALLALWALRMVQRDNEDIGTQFASMRDVAEAVLRGPRGEDKLKSVVVFVYREGHEDGWDEIEKVVSELGPEAEGIQMSRTIAEMLEVRGEARGEARGRALERVATLVQVLTQQLTQKFGALSAVERDRIENASAEELEAWTGRVLGATTIDEVFG